jgi:transcriptional regulator with XRE-family HTH domain
MRAANKNHIGRKISYIRELRGMKQEALATALGITQQAVSFIENSETIEEEKLKQIAEALGVTVDAIRDFSEDAVINIISSTLHDNAGSINNDCTLNFNPMDKLLQVIEENTKLYERLLQSEKDKVVYLEKLMNNGK